MLSARAGSDFEFAVVGLGAVVLIYRCCNGIQFGLCLSFSPDHGFVDRRLVALGLLARPLRRQFLSTRLDAV
jgi:hypothetical protein